MRNPFILGPGGVVSADIAVPEHAREVSFYSQILTTGSDPLWREDLMNNQGNPIIGLGERTPDYESLPLQWMPHFQVSEVAKSAARAVELGANELMHGKDKDGNSQWAVLVDPFGAAFGLIPAMEADQNSAEDVKGIGRIAWLTLVVPDAESACEFYEQIIGWSAASTGVDDKFEMRRADGVASAEICKASGDNLEIPPVWIISLPVGDLGESLRLVDENGGELLKGSAEARYAIIRDPVGVCIGVQADW